MGNGTPLPVANAEDHGQASTLAHATPLHKTVLLLPRSRETDHLDIEDQSGIRRDLGTRTRLAVAHFGGDDQVALFADFHARDAFVPALDDLALAEGELEGF